MRLHNALLSCLLLAAVPAQKLSTTVGTFVDLDGAPVANATVTFATSPATIYDAFAPPTIVTGTTDDRGRFRVALRGGVAHSAWVVGPRAGERCLRSGVYEGVMAGNVLEFAATTAADLPRLRLSEAALLGDGGPFTVVVRVNARHGPALSLPIAADGSVALPPLPNAELLVHVVSASGEVRVGSPSVFAGHVAWADPVEYRFVVRDDKGRLLAGAQVAQLVPQWLGAGDEPFLQMREWQALVAAPPTDAKGATCLTSRDAFPAFVAWADGQALTISGQMGGMVIASGEITGRVDGPLPKPIEFALRPASMLRGRIREGDVPRAGQQLLFSTELRAETDVLGGTSATWTGWQQPLVCDDDGRFQMAVPQMASGLRLSLVPRGPDEPPVVLRPRLVAPEEPLDLDLASWPLVTMQLLDADRGPPEAGQVLVLPGHLDLPEFEPMVLHADRAGRVQVRLEPGRWFLFATDGVGYHARVASVTAGVAAALEFALEPLARLTGRLLDADGQPVADQGFRFGGVQGEPVAGEPAELEQFLRHHLVRLDRGLTQRVRTAADGSFELRFVVVDGVTITGSTTGPGRAAVALIADEGVELRLRD